MTALPGSFPAIMSSQNLSTSCNVPLVRIGCTRPLAVKSRQSSTSYRVSVSLKLINCLVGTYLQCTSNAPNNIQSVECDLEWGSACDDSLVRRQSDHNHRPARSKLVTPEISKTTLGIVPAIYLQHSGQEHKTPYEVKDQRVIFHRGQSRLRAPYQGMDSSS